MVSKKDQERTELLSKIHDDFQARLATLAGNPDEWVEFIEHSAAFGGRYSFGNQLLLLMQATARGVSPQYFLPYGNKAGTTGWLAHGRQVRSGEKAFKIWRPNYRRPTEAELTRWRSEGRTVRTDRDGKPSQVLAGFALASVFDLAQTDGEPFIVPTIVTRRREKVIGGIRAELLVGEDPTDAFDDLVKLIKDQGYTFEPVKAATLGGANGRTCNNGAQRWVRVRDDVSGAQRVKTTAHELAHILCGHLADGADYIAHRGRMETEAESVAHLVTKALGLDSARYTDAYVLNWAGGDLDMIKATGETVFRVAKQILAALDPGERDEAEELAA